MTPPALTLPSPHNPPPAKPGTPLADISFIPITLIYCALPVGILSIQHTSTRKAERKKRNKKKRDKKIGDMNKMTQLALWNITYNIYTATESTDADKRPQAGNGRDRKNTRGKDVTPR